MSLNYEVLEQIDGEDEANKEEAGSSRMPSQTPTGS